MSAIVRQELITAATKRSFRITQAQPSAGRKKRARFIPARRSRCSARFSKPVRLAGSLLFGAALLAGCAGQRSPVIPDPAEAGTYLGRPPYNRPYRVRGRTYYPLPTSAGYRERGIASWYGAESGNRTAMGVRFDPNGLTAAHKSLPLPTRVRVTNLRNGRSVEVLVNDRGPFAKGRLIDLSRGAARAIGMRGLAEVEVAALSYDAAAPEREQAVGFFQRLFGGLISGMAAR